LYLRRCIPQIHPSIFSTWRHTYHSQVAQSQKVINCFLENDNFCSTQTPAKHRSLTPLPVSGTISWHKVTTPNGDLCRRMRSMRMSTITLWPRFTRVRRRNEVAKIRLKEEASQVDFRKMAL
jgi:hypothetical protein